MLSLLVSFSLAASPQVAVLSSSGSTGELRFQPVDASEVVAPVVRFTHAEGSPVLGSLLPESRVVVATAVMQERGDVSFGSVLLRLEANAAARVLADGVVYGSRPHVSREGRVFVSRGRAGAEISAQGRVDSLVVDEVNPTNAKTRTVYATKGFLTFIAGSLGRELFIYEFTTSGARLIAVHVDSLSVRVLIDDMVPMARDFVVDAKRVLFTQGTPYEDAWFVEQLDLATLKKTIVARSNEPTLLPAVLADGRVTFNVGIGALGYAHVQHVTKFGVFTLYERPSDFPVAYVNEKKLTTPGDSRLDLAGVVP